MRADMARMFDVRRSRSAASPSASARSWALLSMTVSGVLSSCEASATNSRCRSQARATGPTAQRAKSRLRPRKARKARAPMNRQFSTRFSMTLRSLDMSAKTRYSVPRVQTRQKRRP